MSYYVPWEFYKHDDKNIISVNKDILTHSWIVYLYVYLAIYIIKNFILIDIYFFISVLKIFDNANHQDDYSKKSCTDHDYLN